MMANIPKDRSGAAPTPERIFGSLPTPPANDPAHAFDAITIPGLAADLNVTYAAWKTARWARSQRPRSSFCLIVVSLFSSLFQNRQSPR